MSLFFTFLFFIAFLALFAGLVSPSLVLRWGTIESKTRSRALKIYGLATLAFLILGVVTAPPRVPVESGVENQQQQGNLEPVPEQAGQQGATTSQSQPIQQADTTEATATSGYKVIKVVDGDTISVDIGGKTETLRLIGINTPETVDPRKPVECFGKEASNKAKELLSGKKVLLEADPSQDERDKYDRLLRYVFFEDGQSYNKLMILEGYAYEYTYNTPYKYQAEYKQSEAEAKQNKRGLWADNACVAVTPAPVSPTPAVTPVVPALGTSYDCSANIYNCTNFKTHSEAQAAYDYCFKQTGKDIHGLDADKDGLACESLP